MERSMFYVGAGGVLPLNTGTQNITDVVIPGGGRRARIQWLRLGPWTARIAACTDMLHYIRTVAVSRLLEIASA